MSQFYRSNQLISLEDFYRKTETDNENSFDSIKLKVFVSTETGNDESNYLNISLEELEKIVDVIRKGDNNEN